MGCLFLLVGCAVAPSRPLAPDPPRPPGAEVEALRGPIQVPELRPPDPASVTDISLEELLAFADANAPAVVVARARARRGEAEIVAASPLFPDNPAIDWDVGSRSIGPDAFFESEVSVRQRVEIAGERGLRLEAARRTRDVALAELDEVRWAVHVEVHRLFFEALVAREQVQLAERVVRFAEELKAIADGRIEAGEDAPVTRLVAQAELAQARERLVEARRRERAVRRRLARVVGWPADHPLLPRGALPAIRRPRSAQELLDLAARHHPAFRARALAVAEAESRVRLEEREAWPEPTFGFAYAREGERDAAADIWLFRIGLPLPLWNRNQGGRARARVALGISRAEQKTLRTSWEVRLQRAVADVHGAAGRGEIYGADVLPAVERNLELIRRAYELGELDILAVSQTRERLLDTQRRAIDARAAYFGALADLEALVGTEIDAALEEVSP